MSANIKASTDGTQAILEFEARREAAENHPQV